MRVITFDMGGTNIKYGVIEEGKILEKNSMPTNHTAGHDDIKKRLLKVVKEYLEKYKTIDGIGVSIACSVNYETSEVVVAQDATPEYSDWNFDKLFFEEYGLHAVADNDVNCFGQAEMEQGAGKEYSTFLVLTIGTGIGGAIIANSAMWRGRNFNAGEVGRMPFKGTTWENKASVTALLKQASAAGLDVKDAKELFELVDSHNETAIKVINKYYNYVGEGLASLVCAFNPEIIVIGGGVSARAALFDDLTIATNKYLGQGLKDTFKLIPAKFLNDGGIIGAYYNFQKRYENDRKEK